jgi:hypothetical protein
MNEQFTKPFTDMFKADMFKAAMPEQLQTLVQDGLAKSREVTVKSIVAAKDGAAYVGKSIPVASAETGALTETAFQQVIENTEAAYDAVKAISLAKTPVEAVQLQAQYMQAQFARAGEQTKELFELTTKVAQKAAQGMGTAFKL